MSSANKNHQQHIEIEELAKGISSIEDYFKEVKKAQDKQRPLLLKHAGWVSFCLSVLGSILLVSSRPILIFVGLLLLLVGLGLFLSIVFVEGREAARTFSNIPLSHLKTMKLEVPSTIKLYKNLAKLEVDALKLLHISLTSQKEYTHNVNKLMLGDLGFLTYYLFRCIRCSHSKRSTRSRHHILKHDYRFRCSTQLCGLLYTKLCWKVSRGYRNIAKCH